MRIGYFLSSEEWGPRELVAQAIKAQEAGFEGLWISDISVRGTTSRSLPVRVVDDRRSPADRVEVTTAVTCPTVRIHPGIVAQRLRPRHRCLTAASVSESAAVRHSMSTSSGTVGRRRRALEMLEEAVEVIRLLWEGGVHDHRGRHYRLALSRLRPSGPSCADVVSGFSPKAIELAARIGDGYCTVGPDAEAVSLYRSKAKHGSFVQAG